VIARFADLPESRGGGARDKWWSVFGRVRGGGARNENGAFLHLDEHALGPDEVGEFPAAPCPDSSHALDEFELCGAGLFRDAKLQRGARFLRAAMAERAKEVIEKKLRPAPALGLAHLAQPGDHSFALQARLGRHG
jgi:hypothetical protein